MHTHYFRHVEWAYSFIDTLRKFASDIELGSMLAILDGELDEEVCMYIHV